MNSLFADVRFALRQLARRPALTFIALATLALGTGAATAIFTIVDGVLLRPLPYPESGRLVALCETHPSIQGFCVASPPNVEDWGARSRTLVSFGLGRSWSFTMQRAEGAEGVSGGLATPGLFFTLGLTPALGRAFAPGDLTPAGRHVAVLSDELWRTRFGADAGVVGRTVVLDGETFEVIGVLRPRSEVPHLGYVRVWVPLPFDPRDEENRRWRGFATFGRLAPGVSVAAAQAELGGIQSDLSERFPQTNRGWGVRVEPLLDNVVGRVRPTLLVFLGAVAILLLVACANVANLLVARGAAREREFAVRAALGARPVRLFRLIATEGLLLALAGGAAGVLVAAWAADAFLALMPAGLPRADDVTLDARVVVFAFGLTIATGLLAGLAPALRAARLDLAGAIKEGHQPVAWRRALGLRGALVVAEVAMAFVLAVGAGLLTRSFASLLRWDPGFEQSGLLTFWTYASSGKYPTAERVAALFEQIERELRTIPSVTLVGMTSAGPLFGGGDGAGEFALDGAAPGFDAPIVASWYDVSPGYFRTLGLSLRRGRLFTEADRGGGPRVVIVNEALARRYFGAGDPVSRRLRMKNHTELMEIIGVVADIPPFEPGAPVPPEIYWPYRQSPRWASYFVLRTTGDPTAIAKVAEARLRAVDPDMSPAQLRTMQDLVNAQLKRPRFNMLLIGVFAALALALAAVGVYGVIAASVVARTREIGVRVALGATARRVQGMVMREGMALALAGLAIGLGAAAGLSRFAASLLYGVRPTDPVTYAGIALLLVGITALACFVPAWRAGRVDPMEALRAE